MIDDYAGFATSDGVLTLVPSFTVASGHSCPGIVRIYDDNGRWLALSNGFANANGTTQWI